MYDEAFTGLSKVQLDEIDATCERFASTRGTDGEESIEEFLAAADEPLRGPLLRELLDIELSFLVEGDSPELIAEYRSRFPEFAEVVATAFEDRKRQSGVDTHARAVDNTGSIAREQVPFPPEFAEVDRQFGRYTLQKLLGRGGMGAVYLAHDTILDRSVALKIPEFNANQDHIRVMTKRFYREARAMATVSHPNLCQIHDVGELNGQPYLTMNYIDGEPLSELIAANRPLAADDGVRIVKTLALAVDAVHQAGIIHRDLKPANVMVRTNISPTAVAETASASELAPADLFITDFGLASRGGPLEPTITNDNSLIGSPAYMAPEQVRAEHDRIGPVTDVYALGVILYELLCGRRPFLGSGLEVLGEISAGKPPPRPSEFSDVDEHLESICLQAIEFNTDDRFQTAADFASALGRWSPQSRIDGDPNSTQRESSDPEPRRRGFGASVLIGLAMLITIVATIAMNTSKIRTPYGEVVVKSAEGVNVEIEVREKGKIVAVIGPDNNWQVRIEGGQYQLKFRGSGHDLSLDRDTVEVSRDDRIEVTILRREEKAPAKIDDADRPDDTWGSWSPAQKLPGSVNHPLADGSPTLTADQRTLVFHRPIREPPHHYQLWMCQRSTKHDEFGPPVLLGAAINQGITTNPHISTDGRTLVFDSRRPGGHGGSDIWISRRTSSDDSWSAAANLGPSVNTPAEESNACLAMDGRLLAFASNRSGGHGINDVWIASRQSADVEFDSPVNAGSLVNGPNEDGYPFLSADGLLLLFSKHPGQFGGWDLFVSKRPSLDAAFAAPVNLGPKVNSSGHDAHGWLSPEGSSVYFESDRDGPGRYDIYQAKRVEMNSP